MVISKFKGTTVFKKNDIIYSKEVFPDAIGVVIKGKAAAVTNSPDGIYMKSFSAGSVFGPAAIFGNKNEYASTIIARSDTEILFIPEDTLKEIFREYPQTSLNYITFLSDRIRFLNRKLSILSRTSAEDTVFEYLCEVKDEDNSVQLSVSMTLLAKMLGLSRATLYRSLDALESGGRITRKNNIIKVIENEKNC